MTKNLAALFRTVFPALVMGLVILNLSIAAIYWRVTGHGLTAAVAGMAGLVILLALFGAVALMIENNRLLHRIAAAAEQQARSSLRTAVSTQVSAGHSATSTEDQPAATPSQLIATRATLTPRKATPQGRTEPPVVTLTRRIPGS
ncbi:hypothetical protein [Gemmobacter denitrificans]|uniref:Uncharacterized protein n=1 Tax=Gemmobacter denitrificans TaxID=3123040 RepID=A0ABU8BXR2_9RHOB